MGIDGVVGVREVSDPRSLACAFVGWSVCRLGS